MLSSLESHANRYRRYIVPLLSCSIDFYVRLFVTVHTSPKEVRRSLRYLIDSLRLDSTVHIIFILSFQLLFVNFCSVSLGVFLVFKVCPFLFVFPLSLSLSCVVSRQWCTTAQGVVVTIFSQWGRGLRRSDRKHTHTSLVTLPHSLHPSQYKVPPSHWPPCRQTL